MLGGKLTVLGTEFVEGVLVQEISSHVDVDRRTLHEVNPVSLVLG